NLTNLRELHLRDNYLTGLIPTETWNLKSLVKLGLGGNQFRGSLPSSVGNLSSLRYLFLFENNLSGSIPPSVGNLMLTVLALENNHFTGNLRHNICRNGALERVIVGGNHFRGPIPKCLRNCPNLVRISLEGNNMRGTISEAFGIYLNLTFLDISDNNFFGEIASNWGKCPKLSTLNVSMNNITRSIPLEIGNLSTLNEFDLSLNHIVGKIPKEFGKLNSLTKLILRGNQLIGHLPSEIGSLTKLEFLNLSTNRFSSLIPESLGNLLKLHYLDLSKYQFIQELPKELGKLVQLSELELSHNFLGREIPSQICSMECCEVFCTITNSVPTNNFLNCQKGYACQKVVLTFQQFSTSAKICPNLSRLPTNHHPQSGCISVIAYVPIIWDQANREGQRSPQNSQGLLSILSFKGKFDYVEIIRAINDFDAKYCIGSGRHGSVYRAELPSKEFLAVKKFNSPLPSDQIADQKEFFAEIEALTKIRHRNIVKFYGFCSHARHSILIYEYLKRGSLATNLSNDAAAEELDISSKNVLLDLEHKAHVSDFGIAKFLKPDSSNWSALVGTYRYVAPDYRKKCDVYSFRVLALEVIKGKHPRGFVSSILPSPSVINMRLDEMLDPRLPPPSPDVQGKLISIMEVAFSCLDVSPESRPTMQTITQQLLFSLVYFSYAHP
ncbi:hypothetical protein CISIN_1g042735mg, partial [Citrus sinensis]